VYDIVAHMEKIPAMVSIFDALQFSLLLEQRLLTEEREDVHSYVNETLPILSSSSSYNGKHFVQCSGFFFEVWSYFFLLRKREGSRQPEF